MSDPRRHPDDGDPTRVYPQMEEPPLVVEPRPTAPPPAAPVRRAAPAAPAAQPAPVAQQPSGPRLDYGKFWAGAVATVLVAALIGIAASVIFEQVFDIGLKPPPDLLDVGRNVSWAGAGALFALAAAVVLQLLVLANPSPRLFFGWLMGLSTVILAVLPWTNAADVLETAMTSLVWVVLGIAIASLLGAVLQWSVKPAGAR